MAKQTVTFTRTKETKTRIRFDANGNDKAETPVTGSLYIRKDVAGEVQTFSFDVELADPAPAAAAPAVEAAPAPAPEPAK